MGEVEVDLGMLGTTIVFMTSGGYQKIKHRDMASEWQADWQRVAGYHPRRRLDCNQRVGQRIE